jgi:hypothetical protein
LNVGLWSRRLILGRAALFWDITQQIVVRNCSSQLLRGGSSLKSYMDDITFLVKCVCNLG